MLSENIYPNTILVVENHWHLQGLLKRILTAKGCIVTTASTIPLAINKIHTESPPFTFVIVDTSFPDDGRKYLEIITKAKLDSKGKTIVLVTNQLPYDAVFGTNIEKEALDTGADGFLQKPFNPMQLLETLADLQKTHLQKA